MIRARAAWPIAVLLAVALLPTFGALAPIFSQKAAAFAQFTDQAVLEIQVLHATKALHLLGPYSRYHWNHPGPLFFYSMLPLYVALGHRSSSLWLSVWLINVACLAAMVLVVHRVASRRHALLTAALLAWQVVLLRLEVLCDPWGPLVVVLPFELLLFLGVGLATGHARLLPLAVLVASFLVQTHIATLPASIVVLTLSAAYGVWASKRVAPEVAGDGFDRNAFRREAWRRPAVTAVAVLCVVWALPLIQQVTNNHGNFSKLWAFFRQRRKLHTWHDAYAAVSDHFCAILNLDPDRGLRSFASVVFNPPPRILFGMAGLLAALCVTFAIAVRRKDRYVATGSAIAMGATAIALLSAMRAAGPLMSYLLVWTTGVGTLSVAMCLGMLADIIVGIVARRHSGDANAFVFRGMAIAALLASAGALAFASAALPDAPYFYGRPKGDILALTRPLEHRLRQRKPKTPVLRISQESWGIVAGVLLQLYKRDVRIFVARPWLFMFGDQFSATEPADAIFTFGGDSLQGEARENPDYTFIAARSGVYVYESAP